MDTQFLESFLLVVEHGSFAEAARKLRLTPAAVTLRVKALEDELGVILVSRSGRTVRPTEAGWLILPQMQTLLSGVRDLRSIANEKTFSGRLSLGAIPCSQMGILPPTFSSLSAKYPQLTISCSPGASSDLYDKVTEGELDAAVIIAPPFCIPKTCEWHTLREEPLIVLAHEKTTGNDVHKMLETCPFIRYDRHKWGGRLADEYLVKYGINVRERFVVDVLSAIAVLVDQGVGISLVPDWAPPWPTKLRIRKIQLPHEFEKRKVGLFWRRSTPRIRLVQALLGELQQSLRHPVIASPARRMRAN